MALIGSFGNAVAEAEGEKDTFLFYGEEFQISDRIGAMPVLKFSHAADSGLATSDMEGLAAMYDMIKDCLRSPWEEPVLDEEGNPTLDDDGSPVTTTIDQMKKFERVATENRATPDEILEICRAIYSALTARPTKRVSVSSGGQATTLTSSKEPSFLNSQELQPVDSLSPEELQKITG